MTDHIETETNGNLVQIKRKRGAAKVAAVPEAEVAIESVPDATPERLVYTSGEVVRLNRDIMANGYKMGVLLSEIAEKRLYVFGGFKTFTTYLASVSVSERWAQMLIKIVKEYSETDFLEVGAKKLVLVLQAAPVDRAQLLEAARNGASVRDLEPQVRVSNAVRRASPTPTPSEENSQTAPVAPLSVARVTCVAREGIYVHDLVDRESEKASTLESLSHHACFTTVEFENGATGIFIVYVDKETNTIKSKIVFKRREA